MTKHHPVAVLVSAGRHPASGAPRACKGDAVALAMGRALAGNALRVVHVGDPSEPSLRDYLALGAGTVEVLSGIERGRIVPALAAILRDCSLILTGTRAETGPGSGLLPYELSEAMGWPVAPNIIAARMSVDGVALPQFLPKGKRRGLAVTTPAIVTVHPLAPADLTYAHARRAAGRIVPLSSAPVAVPAAQQEDVDWTIAPAGRALTRLKAQDQKSAHARLQSALGGDSKRGVVVSEGSDGDKARAVLGYLRENKLIDF